MNKSSEQPSGSSIKKERLRHLMKMAFEKSILISDCVITNDKRRAVTVMKELERVLYVIDMVENDNTDAIIRDSETGE